MIRFIKGSFALAKNIASTGAIAQTSTFVENEITRKIAQLNPTLVVELGAGYGNITRKILEKLDKNALLISVELNEKFCDEMEKNIQDKRLKIVCNTASNFNQFIPENIQPDLIISSLPLSIFPKNISNEILYKVHNNLTKNGVFSQVYYSLFFLKQVKKYFHKNEIKIVVNIPPAFVIHSSK